MKNFLSWLAAGALVASVGGVSSANSTDTFIPIQDPPELSIGSLYQIFGTSDTTSNVADRLYPTASVDTYREGFTGTADSTRVGDGATFDTTRNTAAVDQARVPSGGDVTASSAPFYRQTVDVTTNGPVASIERVALCVINSNDFDVKAGGSEDGNFDWFDSTDGTQRTVSNDVERNCGLDDDDPTYEGTTDSARAGIAIIYDVTNDVFRLNRAGTDHKIVLPTTRDANRTTEQQKGSFAEVLVGGGTIQSSGTLRVHFAFKPSHALAKASSGWVIRAAAQDQPKELDDEFGNGETFTPQVSQIFYGQTEHTETELTHPNVSSKDSFRATWTEIGVAYYGAIVSERTGINYGNLAKGDEVVKTTDAGRYIANSASKFFIDATDFVNGGDSLGLHAGAKDLIPEGEVALDCNYDEDIDSSTGVAQRLRLSNTPKILFSNDTESIESTVGLVSETAPGDPEQSFTVHGQDPEEPSSSFMSCSLKYGGGAANATLEYTNTVTISIADVGSTF